MIQGSQKHFQTRFDRQWFTSGRVQYLQSKGFFSQWRQLNKDSKIHNQQTFPYVWTRYLRTLQLLFAVKKKSLPSIVKLWLKLTWSIPMKSAKLLTMEIRIVCIYMYMYVCDIRTFWLLLIAMFYILTLVSVCAHSQTLKGHWCCP